MTMQSGKLRHLVQIVASADVKDEHGQMVKTWRQVAERYADIKPVASKNLVIADRQTVGRQYVLKIRHLAELNEKMRIVIGGKQFDIFSIMPDPTLQRDMIVQCFEVEDGRR